MRGSSLHEGPGEVIDVVRVGQGLGTGSWIPVCLPKSKQEELSVGCQERPFPLSPSI